MLLLFCIDGNGETFNGMSLTIMCRGCHLEAMLHHMEYVQLGTHRICIKPFFKLA